MCPGEGQHLPGEKVPFLTFIEASYGLSADSSSLLDKGSEAWAGAGTEARPAQLFLRSAAVGLPGGVRGGPRAKGKAEEIPLSKRDR